MTFTKMEAAMEDAFVEWINTFECKSFPIDTLVELADGVILSEILSDIDPKWFKQVIETSENTNWMVRFNNLKKLHKNITRYFEENIIVGQDADEFLPTIQLQAIAKDADLQQLLIMCQLVIAIAVQSDNNKVYIEMIQSLCQKSQHALMVSIEEVMNYFVTKTEQPTVDYGPYKVEFEKVLLEKQQFETSHTQLLLEFNELRERFEDILTEKEELKTRLQNMDEAIIQANSTGVADSLMKTEIDHLKRDLERSEDRRQEMEMMIENHISTINELKRRVEELSVQADQVQFLNDQLEDYKQSLERFQKMEMTIEKYKKKVEDTSDLKRQIKALEDQNTRLLERSHQVEDEYRKVLAFKTLMDSYKEQVQQLESGNREILKERVKLEEELKNMAEACQFLENDRDRNMEQIQLLEEYIKELELNQQPIDGVKVVSHRASVIIDDDPKITMEENMKKTNVTELRLTIGRLQRQIKEMEANSIPNDNEIVQEMETLKVHKDQLQKDYDSVLLERNKLQEELSQIRNGIPDSLLNQTQTIMAFKSRILDLEKDSKHLKELADKLELLVSEGTNSVIKDESSLENFETDHAKLQDRINRLEDITKMQLHDINRMLIEANYLNGINNNKDEDESTSNTPGLSDQDLEVIKEQNTGLQIHVLNLQEEINETQGRAKKIRDMIKLYSQLLKQTKARFSNVTKSEESSRTKVSGTKEDEQELLKKQIYDVREQSKIEQQLIVTAWIELAKNQNRERTSISTRSTPSSWLGQQRKALDVHLRQILC